MRLGVVVPPYPINKCIYHLASHSSLETPRLDLNSFQNSLEMHGVGRKSISKISVRQTFYNLKVFCSPVTVSRREALIKNVKKSTQRAAKHLPKFLSINKAHLCTAVQSSNNIKPTANQDNLSKGTA